MDESEPIQSITNPAVTPNSPPPIVPTQETLPPTTPQNDSSRKIRPLHIFSAVISLILIVTVSSLYLFWWTPTAQAKEYLEETSTDFEQIQDQLAKYKADITNVSKSLETSKEAFTEIGITRFSSEEALQDTLQDIEDISKTLELIKTAKENKEKLTVPKTFEKLDGSLDLYYRTIEDSLRKLYDFEVSKKQLEEAQGFELDLELKKFNDVFKQGTQLQVVYDYLINLSKLASEAKQRYDQIENVHEYIQDQYTLHRNYYIDLENTTKQMVEELKKKTVESQETALGMFNAFGERTKQTNLKIKESALNILRTSPIGKSFNDASDVEQVIIGEFKILKEKYGVKDPQEKTDSTPSPIRSPEEASGSSEATPSAQP